MEFKVYLAKHFCTIFTISVEYGIYNTVFTCLDTTATITLVSKISIMTIQTRPLFDTGK